MQYMRKPRQKGPQQRSAMPVPAHPANYFQVASKGARGPVEMQQRHRRQT